MVDPIASPESPKTPVADWLVVALDHHKRGEFEEANIYYNKILAVEAEHVDALQLLGLVQKQLGNRARALELMHASLRLQPNQPNVWANLGNTYNDASQPDAAYQAYKQAVLRDPKNPQAHFHIGVICHQLHNFKEAEAAFKVVLHLNPNHVEAWRNLGVVYKVQGHSVAALKAFARALQLDASNPVLHMNVANTFKSMGKWPEAEAAYRESIRLKPDFAEAHRHLAQVHSYASGADTHIAEMEMLFHQPGLPEQERMQLCFALAKAYDDAGVVVKSWKYLHEGNQLRRKEYIYDPDHMQRWFDAVREAYPASAIRRHEGESRLEDAPIFIVGMPRSGTSLVEQIIASHHQVHGAGELDELRMLVQRIWPRWHKAIYPAGAENLSAHHKLQLAGEYLRMLRQYMPAGKSRITDKMPGNFRFVGLIHELLPNAKIIHCTRDPMDTCVSIYRHYFSGSHPYAYDLRELGDYYRHYERLMRHWHTVLPEGVMMDMPYEELVADQQFHTRRLLDFCNLSWDDACLAFHETERPVHTASAMQVRQPLYTGAIGRWRNEADYLQPLLDALKV